MNLNYPHRPTHKISFMSESPQKTEPQRRAPCVIQMSDFPAYSNTTGDFRMSISDY